MSAKLGPVYYDYRTEHPFLGRKIATEGGTSPATVAAIEDEARALLTAALEEATEVLRAQHGLLDRLVAALVEKETLEDEELTAILGPSPAPAGGAGRRVGGSSENEQGWS